MNSPSEQLPELKQTFTAYLLGECYDLKSLARWCQVNWPKIPCTQDFRQQLRTAIENRGILTPQTYERWTDDDSYPTQDKLQDHLKEIWNACFPAEKLP